MEIAFLRYVPAGLLLFHERLSPLQLLGAGIIVLGALGSEVTLRRKSAAP